MTQQTEGLLNIIDEQLFISDCPVPQLLVDLEQDMENVFEACKEDTIKRLTENTYRYQASQTRPVRFIIGGGAAHKHLHNHYHEEVLSEEEIFSQTDIDLFVYDNGDVSFYSLAEELEKIMTDVEEVTFDTYNSTYFHTFRIERIYKGTYKGVKVEIIFTNKKRTQSFDINNRNVFFGDGKFLVTNSALKDIQEKRILVTSVHTPVNSLIRALTFSKDEGYHIEPISIKLLTHFIKKMKLNISDKKILEMIETRKTTTETKQWVYEQFRSIIPIEDCYTESDFIVKFYDKVIEERVISSVYTCYEAAKEEKEDLERHGFRIAGDIEEKVSLFIKQNIDKYEYPFHPDTEFIKSSFSQESDEENEAHDFLWSKTMYDAIVNYTEHGTTKFDHFRNVASDISFKIDIKDFTSPEGVYEKVYLPACEFFNKNVLTAILKYDLDNALENHSIEKITLVKGLVSEYLGEEDPRKRLYQRKDYARIFQKPLPFEEVAPKLLDFNFLVDCLIIFGTNKEVNTPDDIFLEQSENDEHVSQSQRVVAFLLYHLHFNHFYVKSEEFNALTSPLEKRTADSIFSELVFFEKRYHCYKGFNDIKERVLNSAAKPKEKQEIFKENTQIGRCDFCYDNHSSKLTTSGFTSGSMGGYVNFFREINDFEIDYSELLPVFTDEFKENGYFDLFISPTYAIQYVLTQKYPDLFSVMSKETSITPDFNHNENGGGYYFNRYNGQAKIFKIINFEKRNKFDEFFKKYLTIQD